MEPETCTAAKGKDAEEDQNVPDPSTGDKADQDQQILIEERDMYWYKSTLALKNLQAAFVPVAENVMKSLQEETQSDFGRQLCKEATAEDIKKGKRRNQAYFEHACPGTSVSCQCLLNIIKTHTTDSVPFFKMLQGTDPQNWLKSPFEFVRLFLQDYLKFQVQDFQDCDITAFCSIIKRCKPLMQMFGSKIDAVKEARNKTFHCSRMNISKQEMEDIVDVILDFLLHIQSLKSTDEVTKAIGRIKLVKSGDIRLSQCKDAIQGWLPSARRKLEHTLDVAKNLQENINYVENEWARLSPEVAATINKGEESTFEVKILIEEGDMYWYRSTLALKDLQAAFVPVVENEMKSLQEKTQTDFGRQLCKEATAKDIIKEKRQAYFKHACPGTPVSCQCLLNMIKTLTIDSVPFFEMLKGTDPQNWLKSPFEFVRLFLQDYLKFQVHDFQDCDITAFCSIIKRCKPLMQMFGSKIDAVRQARNETFHCSRMRISKQEMEDIVDVILDFLQHIKSLKNTDDVTKAIKRIKLVKSDDIRFPQCKDAIQGWLPSATSKLVHTLDVAKNLQENINYVENEWARLSQKVAATKDKGEEPKFEVKLQDEKERKRELEKQFEGLMKRLSPSDTAIASTSFEGRHTPEVSSMTLSESSDDSSDTLDSSSGPSQPKKAMVSSKKLSESSDDSSDTSDSSFGPSQPKKFKPSVAGSTENMAAAQCKERRQKTDYDRRRKIREPANVDRNTLKISSLTVNGLKERFKKNRKFLEFIKEHDIACFMETNLDDNDVLNYAEVEGYTFYRKNRSVTKRRSRGIGIYVKNTIKVVEEIVCSCEYVLWLKIKAVFEPLKETVVLGAVYIPCVGNKDDYAKIMEEFETEVESKRSEYKNVILAGDFNCSTGTLQDYTVNEHSANWFKEISALFKRLSIPLERSSQDEHRTTAKGKELIKLCKREQMFILNGRLNSDKGKGEITCRIGKHSKGSVNDYVIATDTCLELFKSFKVKDVTTYERFSDFHSALIFELGCDTLQCK